MNKSEQKSLVEEKEAVLGLQDKDLLAQCKAEFDFSRRYMKSKFDKWNVRLKLYNNQKRDDKAIGDPLLFTIHQTVLASLYDDDLMVKFLPRERGDEEVAENLNLLAKYDSEAMGKAQIDYDWDWSTTFFGHGLVLLDEFDDRTNTPKPQVIDMMSFFRDPTATSINGDLLGNGSSSFFGRQILTTAYLLEQAGVDKDIIFKLSQRDGNTDLETNMQNKVSNTGSSIKSYSLKGDNAQYVIVEWFTHYNGKKIKVYTDKDFKYILIDPVEYDDYFPLIDRTIYPIPYDWDGVSIPDLVEDKQRARATAQNLSLNIVKAGLYPMYLYDKNRIKNKNSIAKFEFNKFIGINGSPDGAILPLQTKNVNSDVSFILQELDRAAQKATSTPELQQGMMGSTRRTATELAQAQQNVDTRYSLSMKVFGWSEKDFWHKWHNLYKQNMTGMKKKTLRIGGVLGGAWRDISADNIKGKSDFDVYIESSQLANVAREKKLASFANYMSQAVATDPNSNKREFLKYMGYLTGLSVDEMNRLLPKTVDDYEIDKENEMIENGKLPEVDVKQDHLAHITGHSYTKESKVKDTHIKAHIRALLLKREHPEDFVEQDQQANAMQQTGRMPAELGVTPSKMQTNYQFNKQKPTE